MVASVAARRPPEESGPGIAVAGFSVGMLGGLIGLGGAEFRLPLLIGVFGFAALRPGRESEPDSAERSQPAGLES